MYSTRFYIINICYSRVEVRNTSRATRPHHIVHILLDAHLSLSFFLILSLPLSLFSLSLSLSLYLSIYLSLSLSRSLSLSLSLYQSQFAVLNTMYFSRQVLSINKHIYIPTLLHTYIYDIRTHGRGIKKCNMIIIIISSKFEVTVRCTVRVCHRYRYMI